MKAILINPKEKTVEEIEFNGKLDGIQKAIGCQTICGAGNVRNGDVIYVDDEGLFTEERYYTYLSKQILVGNLLITGIDPTGNTVDVNCTAEEVRGQLAFLSSEEAKMIAVARGI